jgi:hypothetical protein
VVSTARVCENVCGPSLCERAAVVFLTSELLVSEIIMGTYKMVDSRQSFSAFFTHTYNQLIVVVIRKVRRNVAKQNTKKRNSKKKK